MVKGSDGDRAPKVGWAMDKPYGYGEGLAYGQSELGFGVGSGQGSPAGIFCGLSHGTEAGCGELASFGYGYGDGTHHCHPFLPNGAGRIGQIYGRHQWE